METVDPLSLPAPRGRRGPPRKPMENLQGPPEARTFWSSIPRDPF
ncbi:MAG: hypothetical protein QXI39_03415 [Candidatus Bathyarchaeia archaeon]